MTTANHFSSKHLFNSHKLWNHNNWTTMHIQQSLLPFRMPFEKDLKTTMNFTITLSISTTHLLYDGLLVGNELVSMVFLRLNNQEPILRIADAHFDGIWFWCSLFWSSSVMISCRNWTDFRTNCKTSKRMRQVNEQWWTWLWMDINEKSHRKSTAIAILLYMCDIYS